MMIREVDVSTVRAAVQTLIAEAAYRLPPDYLEAIEQARRREHSAMGQSILLMLQENAAYAETEQMPTCQDTGMAIITVTLGQDVHLVGGDINNALSDAVRNAYAPLRKSVIRDPLLRENTGDNTPPIVTYHIVPGRDVHISLLMKGFGAEMMSELRMLPPAAGEAGVREFVVACVDRAGPNACPPVIVGVGLGSSFDGVARLAKEALARPLGEPNPEEHLARLERQLLAEINALGIGPQGLGGTETALAVHIESAPTHIAALPVAVNLNCSAPRRATVTL